MDVGRVGGNIDLRVNQGLKLLLRSIGGELQNCYLHHSVRRYIRAGCLEIDNGDRPFVVEPATAVSKNHFLCPHLQLTTAVLSLGWLDKTKASKGNCIRVETMFRTV